MKINFTSKFNVKDTVWFMYNEEPTEGVIYNIECKAVEYEAIAFCKSVIVRTVNEIKVMYSIDRVVNNEINKINPAFKKEEDLFSTKEELLKSIQNTKL